MVACGIVGKKLKMEVGGQFYRMKNVTKTLLLAACMTLGVSTGAQAAGYTSASQSGPGVGPRVQRQQIGPGVKKDSGNSKPVANDSNNTANNSTIGTPSMTPASAIAQSGVSIYVSKLQRKLTLYKDGQEVNHWDCNIGKNVSAQTKSVEGDAITPMGSFYVCTRNSHSVAYKSLGLSYPTASDADRGFSQGIITAGQRDAIKNAIANRQCPPWNTALGGEIMIHGGYSPTGTTHGCVAVANSVMDVLWQYGQLGIQVTIGI